MLFVLIVVVSVEAFVVDDEFSMLFCYSAMVGLPVSNTESICTAPI